MKPFDVQDLLDVARQRTGLFDFGPADFLEGLRVLVGSLNEQAEISDSRWDDLYERFQRLLINRLWFAEDLRLHPEIMRELVDSPVIIVSLPRTGSTKLHRMLGATDDFQTVKFWQVNRPSRIPGSEDGGRTARIQQTRDYEKWIYKTSPELITGHALFTDEPEEDQLLNEFSFRTTYLGGAFNIPKYNEWLMRADANPTYDYFLAQIKYLQWQSRLAVKAPWLLKTPNHLGKEHQLARIFKRPRFIVTHRDPVTAVASIANPVRHTRKLYSDADTLPALGALLTQMFGVMALEHIRWRDRNPDVRILDLSFREINADGLSAAQKVYDFLGMGLGAGARHAMSAWERENEREKHGRNVYGATIIGTTDKEIRHAFARYTERFAEYL